jgi:phosphoribosylformylglycinamidine cyclo-ligase
VDIAAADRAKERYEALVASTRRPEVLADIGPFAGLFDTAEVAGRVLVASADGVGTKVKIARLLGRYETIGHDIVGHSVNDQLTAGGRPLFFLDYLAGNGLTEDVKVAIVRGVAEACREVGMALLGGETADMPGVYAPGEFDLAGFIIGVVERDRIIDGSRIVEGDSLLVLPSNGMHTNGYSLARGVLGIGVDGDPDEERARAGEYVPALATTLGEALLRPHMAYLRQLEPVLERARGLAHITGGGLPGNVNRILPPGLAARLDPHSWPLPPIFPLLQERGQIATREMFRAFNMGAGMVLACAPEDAGWIRERVPDAVVAGRVERRAGTEAVIIEGVN